MRYNVVKVELIHSDIPEKVAKLLQSSLVEAMVNGPDPKYPTTYRVEEILEIEHDPDLFEQDQPFDHDLHDIPRDMPDIADHIGWCKECGYMVRQEDVIAGHPSQFECRNCNHPHTIDELLPKD